MKEAGLIAAAAIGWAATGLQAQTLNTYGMPGLIDMPSAEALADGTIAGTLAASGSDQRVTLTFQLAPRLTASFRYAELSDWSVGGQDEDRSFDVQFLLLEESERLPAVAIGLRDFMGKGTYGAEYIVASKTFAEDWTVTAGLGWGRLSNSATLRTAANPQGGVPTAKQWFDGDIGAFAGIAWRPDTRWTLKAEYSSDKYTREVAAGAIERKSPVNFGIEYRTRQSLTFGLYWLHGSELSFRFSAAINPRRPPTEASMERAPIPVVARRPVPSSTADPAAAPGFASAAVQRFETVLKEQGLQVEALAISQGRAELRIENPTYNASAQAIGRAARAMALVLPPSIETFVITPTVRGVPASSVTIRRTDLEALEFDPQGPERMFAHASIASAFPLPAEAARPEGRYPRLSWSIAPYVSLSLFDGGGPLRGSVGLRAAGDWHLAPGLSLSGSVAQEIAGNLKDETPPPSGLPRVRTDRALYKREGRFALERLTLDYLFKPAPDWFGRVSVGYLEPMFGGVSGEILWHPAHQSWGLGAEINYARQRDFNQRLGFRDYDVVTGHVSAYWKVNTGLHAQLDVGRYLAGDWGATLSVDRVFANGWRVGAYATVTDADHADYGEGSFTKGFRVTVPLSWGIGTPSRRVYALDLNTLARDGGARLDVRNRLYDLVAEYQRPGLEASWARFWR